MASYAKQSSDLDSFVADFMKCKITFRNLQMNCIKIEEELNYEKKTVKQLNENGDALSAENSQMMGTISSLHLALKNLPKTEEENKELKNENKKLKKEIEQTLKACENETKLLKSKIQEIIFNHTEEVEKLKHNGRVAEKQLHAAEEELSNTKECLDVLRTEITTICEKHDQEKLNLQLEYQLKISRIEKQLQIPQRPPTFSGQDIFRQKLQHLQKQHANELATLQERINMLEAEIGRDREIATRRPAKKQGKFNAGRKTESSSSTFPEDSVATVIPLKPTFRKRKLFLVENSYLDSSES